jgi:hypothetical protein
VPQGNTIRPAPQDPDPSTRMPGDTVYIGNGDYSFVTPFAGLGLRWQADWTPPGGAAIPVEEDGAPMLSPARGTTPAVEPTPRALEAPPRDQDATSGVTTDPIAPGASADGPSAAAGDPVAPAEQPLPAAARSTGRRPSRPR